MRTALKLIVLIPIAVIAILLAVANRQMVRFVLDPFASDNAYGIDAPLFVIVLLALATGLVVGGLATWLTQYRFRVRARQARRETRRQQDEVTRLRTALDAMRSENTGVAPVLPAPRDG